MRKPDKHEVLVYSRDGKVIVESTAANGDQITFTWEVEETDQIIDDLTVARSVATEQINAKEN